MKNITLTDIKREIVSELEKEARQLRDKIYGVGTEKNCLDFLTKLTHIYLHALFFTVNRNFEKKTLDYSCGLI